MKTSDYSGTHRYKVHSLSETFTLIDGFDSLENAVSFAKNMIGSFNNAGSSGESEEYTSAKVVLNNQVVLTFKK